MHSLVSLFTRPLSYAMLFPSAAASSQGKDYLRHWGVLISDMSLIDLQVILSRTRDFGANVNTMWGTMLELFRDEDKKNNVNIKDFGMKTLREEWPMFSMAYVGKTSMTFEQIKHQGIYLATLIADLPLAIEIVTRYPDYRLFTNNCQNFVKYLLEALCPDAPIPNTIESVLFGLQEISCGIIPGAYPQSSILSADCDSFVTASGTSWWTATETSWLTAANYSLITMENISQYGEDTITGKFPGDGQNTPRRQRIAGKGFAAFQRRLIGRKALIDASRVGDVERVKKLLGINANTEIKDKYGWTALRCAATNGHLEVVKFLVREGGADVESKDDGGRTALSRAAENGHLEVVKFLVQEGGADVESKDDGGWTPLSFAAANGRLEAVKFLVEQGGADVESKDEDGDTPLSWAALSRHLEVVKFLIEEGGADVESKSNTERTALSHAAGDSHLNVVKFLVEQGGADVESKSNTGRTPLSCAAGDGRLDVVKFLVREGGADVESKSNTGRTPLSRAADYGHLDVVKFLVREGGANVESKDKWGNTALDLAREGLTYKWR